MYENNQKRFFDLAISMFLLLTLHIITPNMIKYTRAFYVGNLSSYKPFL